MRGVSRKKLFAIGFVTLILGGYGFIASNIETFGASSNDRVLNSEKSGVETVDVTANSKSDKSSFSSNWKSYLKPFSKEIKVLREDGSETNDFLDIYCGNLSKSDGGMEQFACGEEVATGKEGADRTIHIKLLTAKENSAFDGVNGRMWLEVVRNDDGRVVVCNKDCVLEDVDDNVFLDLSSESFRDHLKSHESGSRCICNDLKDEITKVLKNHCLKRLKFKLSDADVQQGLKSDRLNIDSFLTPRDLDLLNKGECDIRKFTEFFGKEYTFKFYRMDGHKAALVAKIVHKFE